MNARVAVVLAAAVPLRTLAQQEPAERFAPTPVEHRTVPELNGHVFQPSFLVDLPFRMTTFKLGLLYGVGDATGPSYDINGNVTGTKDYTFAAMAQTFRFEYQFLEWLSAGAFVVTTMYSGIDGPSAIAVGAQVGIGGGLRARAGHRFGPVETAFTFDVSDGPEYGILVAAAVVAALRDRVIEPGQALQTTHSLTVNPGLSASWAPWPALGLTANAGYVFKSLHVSETNILDQNAIQFAGVADLDLNKLLSWSISVTGGYRVTAGVGNDSVPTTHDVSGGIFYNGIRELAAGVEVGWRKFTLRPNTSTALDSHATIAQIEIQYYW